MPASNSDYIGTSRRVLPRAVSKITNFQSQGWPTIPYCASLKTHMVLPAKKALVYLFCWFPCWIYRKLIGGSHHLDWWVYYCCDGLCGMVATEGSPQLTHQHMICPRPSKKLHLKKASGSQGNSWQGHAPSIFPSIFPEEAHSNLLKVSGNRDTPRHHPC